jgi:hypothetical protein
MTVDLTLYDFEHPSFKKQLSDNTFEIKTEWDASELAEHLETYPFYVQVLESMFVSTYTKANGITPDLLEHLLKLRLETDLYIYLSRDNPDILSTLSSVDTQVFDIILGKILKICNSCIYQCGSETVDFEDSDSKSHMPLEDAFYLFKTLVHICADNIPKFKYNQKFTDQLGNLMTYASELAVALGMYAKVNVAEDMQLDVDIVHEKQEKFLNALELDSFSALSQEIQIGFLQAWQAVLEKHRLILAYFFGDISAENSLEDFTKAKKLFGMLEDAASEAGIPVGLSDSVRDIYLSLQMKMDALKAHLGTNKKLELDYLHLYEKVLVDYSPKVLASLN